MPFLEVDSNHYPHTRPKTLRYKIVGDAPTFLEESFSYLE